MASTTNNTSSTTVQPPILQPQTLHSRLLTKEAKSLTADRGSLSKCAHRMRDFLSATQAVAALSNSSSSPSSSSSQDDDDRSTALHHLQQVQGEFIRELELHNLELRKLELAAQVAQTEYDYYESLLAETQCRTQHIQTEIQDLKQELQASLQLKANVEQYDALAKLAHRYTSLRESTQRMEEVNKEMETLRGNVKASQQVLEVRGGQFQLLLQTIADLQQTVQS